MDREIKITAFVESLSGLTSSDAIMQAFIALYREVGTQKTGSHGSLNRAITLLFTRLQTIDAQNYPCAARIPGEVVIFSSGSISGEQQVQWQRIRLAQNQILDYRHF